MKSNPCRILALETSGRVGGVAVGTEDGLVAVRRLSADFSHKAELMPAIAELLGQQGWPADSITDVFVSIGPGSFTGLRIGVTIARTLAWSIGTRLVAVGTLDGLARNALSVDEPPAHLAVFLDAYRSRVFAAGFEYRDDRYVRIVDACMVEPGEFLQRCAKPVAVLGEGVGRYRQTIEAGGARILDESLWSTRAEQIFHLGLEQAAVGRFVTPRELVPMYIRRPSPEEKRKQTQQRS